MVSLSLQRTGSVCIVQHTYNTFGYITITSGDKTALSKFKGKVSTYSLGGGGGGEERL
jgi:hypothetical protein